MNKTFIKTKNVKKFIGLMEELQRLPYNIPKLALVYGDYGLGKSQAIMWWADKNDAVYVRATRSMSARWLMNEIATELNLKPYWHIQDTFNLKYHKFLDKLTQQDVSKILNEINLPQDLCETFFKYSNGNTRRLEHLISHSLSVAKINQKDVDKNIIRLTSKMLMA